MENRICFAVTPTERKEIFKKAHENQTSVSAFIRTKIFSTNFDETITQIEEIIKKETEDLAFTVSYIQEIIKESKTNKEEQ